MNKFSGNFFANGTWRALESNNLDSALEARGLTQEAKLVKLWDVNPTVGGPIKTDKLWFYYGYRNWGNSNGVPGNFINQTPTSFVYTPDYSRQGVDDTTNISNVHPEVRGQRPMQFTLSFQWNGGAANGN